MSDLAATAEVFERGVLASKVAGILARPAGRALDRKDQLDLDAAKQLVVEMLRGAETLQSKQSVAGVTAQSIKSLGVALIPLATAQRLREGAPLSEEVVVAMLEAMNTALSSLRRRHSVPATTREMELTRTFFTILADSILSSLNRRKRLQGSAAQF